jgi:hypothetical protein
MEIWQVVLISYIVGSAIGYFLAYKPHVATQNELLDVLIEEGFLRHKTDKDGRIIILKYHDNVS